MIHPIIISLIIICLLGVFHFSFLGQYGSDPLSISFISNVEANDSPDEANPGDFTGGPPGIFDTGDFTGGNMTDTTILENLSMPDFTLGIQNYSANDPSANPSIECSNQDFSSRGCVVAQQLTNLNGSEIAGFGLIDYDDNAIIHALNLLDTKNLEKVLQNLPTEDLISLKERLGMDTLNPILKRISLDHREEILARLKQ